MKINGKATHTARKFAIVRARIELLDVQGAKVASTRSDEGGNFTLAAEIPDGKYTVRCVVFDQPQQKVLEVVKGKDDEVLLEYNLGFQIAPLGESQGQFKPVSVATAGKRLILRAVTGFPVKDVEFHWTVIPDVQFFPSNNDIEMLVPDNCQLLHAALVATEKNAGADETTFTKTEIDVPVLPPEKALIEGDIAVKGRVALQEPIGVRLLRTASDPTLDQALWVAIRNRTRAISFGRYQDFMNRALNWEERNFEVPKGVANAAGRERIQRDLSELGTHMHGVRAYQTLRHLTETFLLLECGVRINHESERTGLSFDPGEERLRLGENFSLENMEEKLGFYLGENAQLPYITRVVKTAFPEMAREGWWGRLISAKFNEPCLIELIWSYWMEEGMLVQTMNAVTRRFQNVRAEGDRDPLANMEIDPLRPLNNLLWGYIQGEFNHLTVRRRAYEYVHHYGLTLYGKAAAGINAADTRSKFLEAFHNLLFQSSIFFKEDFQTTVIADGFPLLNSLKEVHLILAQGAQNQFGDLPWTARAEMLLMQYMLARREIRDFLQSRAMVPYKEPWEAQVDTMKAMQGWTDVTVTHFRDLAVYGEQLLLSIRFGDWIAVNDENSAKNWARYFRPEIQGYLHAYRAVTGIDLTNGDTVDATIPGILLQKRMVMQRAR
jgi:hypothetical protein